MRGKVDQQSMLCSCKGITPAYAGKRLTLHKIWQTVRDHPRLCGEKVLLERPLDTVGGSPPPMRGKVQYGRTARRPVRITPAYAGKRKILGGENGGNQDHPRLCGEKTAGVPITSSVSGSPPPMRGKGKCDVAVLQNGRITPAYAGKSSHVLRSYFRRTDHPRLCGEKYRSRA